MMMFKVSGTCACNPIQAEEDCEVIIKVDNGITAYRSMKMKRLIGCKKKNAFGNVFFASVAR